MKRLVCFISTASLVTLGLAAVPRFAGADITGTTEAADESATGSGHRGGLIDKALEEVHLRPDQKAAVDRLKAEAEKRHEAVRAAKDEFVTAIANQVEDGKLNRCVLAPRSRPSLPRRRRPIRQTVLLSSSSMPSWTPSSAPRSSTR